MSRYFDKVIQLDKLSFDDGILFDQVLAEKKLSVDLSAIKPDNSGQRLLYLLNGNFNYETDIQKFLTTLKSHLGRSDRIACVVYNSYLRWVYQLASFLNFRRGPLPEVFITSNHLHTLANISGFEIVKIRPASYFPFKLLGIGTLINTILPSIPLLRWLGFTSLVVFRPVIPTTQKPKLSIVIPARNEQGNIENAITRLESFLEVYPAEIIFVEGHSQDETWKEILRVVGKYSDKHEIRGFQQSGVGKVDAVRNGFSNSTGELLTILDADLTMPPELLHRFYDAWMEGKGDFINGSRLVYPMEDDSMRFLNRLGNIFFAKALSYSLDTSLTDSLCGTKLLTKKDYERFLIWRNDFGDIDPFGDFELIFPAATMGLGIVDIPIKYRSRTYGSTNINRFRHGLTLLRMTLIAILNIKFCRQYKNISRPQ